MGYLKVDEVDDHVVAALSRPEARNAIDVALVGELHELCSRLERDPRILVLTGSEGTFAAGADIKELRERGPEDALRGITSRVFDRIASLPLPTIAAVDGPAIGGGAELAYACDFRLATPRARFGNPEVQLGIIAAAGACFRLRELIGLPLAADVLLAGRQLSAEESLACGLVSLVVEPEDLVAATSDLVRRLSRGSALALRLTKIALGASPAAHPTIDEVAQAVAFQTEEKYQRMSAFLERRKPE